MEAPSGVPGWYRQRMGNREEKTTSRRKQRFRHIKFEIVMDVPLSS